MSIIINEVDNSSPTVTENFAGIPAAVIGTAQTGPAFVPQLVNSEASWTETFGDVDSEHWGSIAVRAWYNEAQANAGLVYLRVLGAGDGKKRTTNNRVNNAGFVVGSNNVRTEDDKASIYGGSSVTVGALQKNPFANTTSQIHAGEAAKVVLDHAGQSLAASNKTIIVKKNDVTILTVTTNTSLTYDATPTLVGTTHALALSGSPSDTDVFAALAHLLNQLDGYSAAANGASSVTVTSDTKDHLTTDITVSGTYVSEGFVQSSSTPGTVVVQAQAAPGRTYFLSMIMSESAGSTYLTDAGLAGVNDPILRAVILVASGVQLQVSGWRPSDSGHAEISGSNIAVGSVSGSAGHADEGNWIGAMQQGESQSIKLILNGLKESDSRVISFGMNPDKDGYLSGLNDDPKRFDELGHYLYAHYPVPTSMAEPCETAGVIHTFQQKNIVDGAAVGDANRYFHNILLTTGSANRNQYGASGYKPNYEGWEDRFSTPFTPWIISQPVGGVETKLFRLHALDDGQGTEDQYFAEICNIIYPSDAAEYSTFSLKVRRYGVQETGSTATRANPYANSILFEHNNLTLDPNSPNYIARVIGDYHRYYNFDVDTNEQKLVLAGMYENTNKYVRVEVTADVSNGKTAKDLVPFGFQGLHHLVTSGSSEMLSDIQTGEKWYEPYLQGDDDPEGYAILSGGMAGIGQGMIVPPVPLRFRTLNDSTATVKYPWGVRFDNPTNGTLFSEENDPTSSKVSFKSGDNTDELKINNSETDLWGNGPQIDLIRQLNKFYPSYSASPMWVGDNAGVADTANGAVLDSNLFNRNKFSLGKILVATETVNSVEKPIKDRWYQAYYIRDGANPGTTGFRFLKAADLKSANDTQEYTRFVLPFQGGFDGLNIFDKNKYALNHWAAHFEQENSDTLGGLLGPTVAAYRKAVDIIAEKTDVDINALAIPGQRSSFVTEFAANKMEERFDAIYLMDPEICDNFGTGAGNVLFDGRPDDDDTRSPNTTKTIERFAGRGLSNSFSAAYFPNVTLSFSTNERTGGIVAGENIGINASMGVAISDAPGSIAALAAFARTDRREGAWGTPAGYDNGRPAALINAALRLTATDSKDLAVNAINPIVIFNDNVNPEQGTQTDLGTIGTGIVNGQRTLLNKDSALSRLDVRKLMVYIRRKTRDIAYNYIFEPNQKSVLANFSSEVENLLETLVTAGAVKQFRVVIDETTTSQADIENNTVRGKVFVQPYRSVEIIAIDININNSDQA